MEKLSHYDAEGSAHMVDVSGKAATRREAEAPPLLCSLMRCLPHYRKTPRAIRWRLRVLPAFKQPNAPLT